MDDRFVEIPGRIPAKFLFRTNSDRHLKERAGIMWFSGVKASKIEWMWEPYIPLGRLTLLGGDPGTGKSFITAALSAALTTGRDLPGEEGELRAPMNVLMLSVEDDPADTLAPRLKSLGADLDRIAFSTEDIVLDKDGLVAIREMVRATCAKLVILDPIVAFLGPKMDMNRANEVRHIMKGLYKIAKEENIAILVVRHNRKEMAGSQGKAIYAGMGSIDFTASVRSELAVNETRNGTKFLNHIKTNSGRKGASITYSITSDKDGEPVFAWGDFAAWPPSSAGAKVVIAKRFKDEVKLKSWLFDLLKQAPDGLIATDIVSRGSLMGFSQTKLEHAKKGVAVSVKRGQVWFWKLSPDAQVENGDQSVIV